MQLVTLENLRSTLATFWHFDRKNPPIGYSNSKSLIIISSYFLHENCNLRVYHILGRSWELEKPFLRLWCFSLHFCCTCLRRDLPLQKRKGALANGDGGWWQIVQQWRDHGDIFICINYISKHWENTYVYIYIYTIWLFNSSPWKDPPFLMGKPSISGPCSMAMSNNQRIYKLRVCWWLSHQLQHLFLAQALRSFHLLPILDWGWSAQVMTSHS